MKEKKPLVLQFVRKPTVVDIFLVSWWLLLIATGVVGLFGFPSVRVSQGVGGFAAQYVVSGTIVVVAAMGFLARTFKAHEAEAMACFGIAFLTVCHASLFIFAQGNFEVSIQTGLRLLANASLCGAIGLLIGKHYVLGYTKKGKG